MLKPRHRTLAPELIEHELDLARRVQEALSPAALPAIPGIRLAAMNRPARIVSGDLYDVIRVDPERLVLFCADVSGKGFAAALLAAEFHAYCRSLVRAACAFADGALNPLPLQVVTLLNSDSVAPRTRESGHYATLMFAEFDTHTSLLQYVNAGHNPPLLLAPGLPPVELDESAVLHWTPGGLQLRRRYHPSPARRDAPRVHRRRHRRRHP